MEEHEEKDSFKGMIYCAKCKYWHEYGTSCGCDENENI